MATDAGLVTKRNLVLIWAQPFGSNDHSYNRKSAGRISVFVPQSRVPSVRWDNWSASTLVHIAIVRVNISQIVITFVQPCPELFVWCEATSPYQKCKGALFGYDQSCDSEDESAMANRAVKQALRYSDEWRTVPRREWLHTRGEGGSHSFALTVRQRNSDLFFVTRSEANRDGVRSKHQSEKICSRGRENRPMSFILCGPI